MPRLRAGRRLTLAIAVTAPDGAWTAAVAPKVNVLLRALHRPSPATLSDWVSFEVAPRIALRVTAGAPLQVSGTIVPPKEQVTVELHRGSRVTGAPVRTKRLAAANGRFAGTIRRPKPGRYTLIARSAEDADNVAGTSPPIPLAVT